MGNRKSSAVEAANAYPGYLFNSETKAQKKRVLGRGLVAAAATAVMATTLTLGFTPCARATPLKGVFVDIGSGSYTTSYSQINTLLSNNNAYWVSFSFGAGGTLNLTADNAYAPPIASTMSGGTIYINAEGGYVALSGFSGGSGSGSYDYPGLVSTSSGNTIILENGTFGDVDYSGVTAGTIQVGGGTTALAATIVSGQGALPGTGATIAFDYGTFSNAFAAGGVVPYNITVSGTTNVIDGGGASGTFTGSFSGSGNLTLQNATFELAPPGPTVTNIGFTGTFDIKTGATVLLDSQGALTSGGFILDGGTLKNNSGGPLNFSPANTIEIDSGGFTIDAYGQSSTLQGVISGAGSLIIGDTSTNGGGIVGLYPTDLTGKSTANTYSGGTTIENGVSVGFNNNGSFGTGDITIDAAGGALGYSAGGMTLANNLILNGSLRIDAGGFTGSNTETYSGTITDSTSGTTLVVQNGTLLLTGSSNSNDFTAGTFEVGNGATASTTVQFSSLANLPATGVEIYLNSGSLQYTGLSGGFTLNNNIAITAGTTQNAIDAGGPGIETALNGTITNTTGTLALTDGTFAVSHSFTGFTGGSLQIGTASSGVATLDFTGGADGIELPGSAVKLLLVGGTLAATATGAMTIPNAIYVFAPGATEPGSTPNIGGVIDADGQDLTLTGDLSMDADATTLVLQNGVFAFSLAGSVQTVSGTLQIGNGIMGATVLKFDQEGQVPSVALSFDGGWLRYTGATGSAVSIDQTIQVQAAGGVIDAGGLTSSGPLQLNGFLTSADNVVSVELTNGTFELKPSAGNNLGFTGTLLFNGGGSLLLDSQNAMTGGGFDLNGGTIVNNSGRLLAFNSANTISLGTNGGAIDAGGKTVGLYSIISGGGALTLESNSSGGMVALYPTDASGKPSVNTFSGGTMIRGTAAAFDNSGSFGTGPINIGVASAAVGGTLTPAVSGLTLANPIQVNDAPTSNTPDIYNNNGFGSTISGQITGAGGLVVEDGGALQLAGANSYAGGTVIQNSATVIAATNSALGGGDVTLTTGANLTSINALGSIAYSPLTINVGGNYTQDASSTLYLALNYTSNDTLQVAGTANLNGKLDVVFLDGFVPALKQKFTVVTAKSIVGQFASISAPEGAVFSQDTSSGNTDVITLQSLNNPGLIIIATEDEAGIALVNADIAGLKLLGELDTWFNNPASFNASSLNIINTPNADPFTTALNSAMQSMGRAAQASANQNSTSFLDASDSGAPASPEAEVPLPTSESQRNTFSGFAAGEITVATDLPGSSPGQSSSFNTGGVTAGLGYSMAGHLVIGPVFSYNYTGSNLDNIGSRLQTSAYSPGLFVGLRQSHFHLDALASYTYNTYRIDRNVTVPAGVATSSPTGNQFDASSQLIYYFHVAPGLKLGPSGGLAFTNLDVSGYTETGDGVGDMTVSPVSFDSLRSLLGGQLNYAWRIRPTAPPVNFTANAYWQHEYLNLNRGVIAQPIGGSSFVSSTPSPGRDSALLGAGVSGNLAKKMTLFISYEAQLGPNSELVNSAMVGLAIALR